MAGGPRKHDGATGPSSQAKLAHEIHEAWLKISVTLPVCG